MLRIKSVYCIVTRVLLGTFLVGLGSSWASAQTPVELLKTLTISGSATDLSNLTEDILPGVPHNQFGGISAIEWTGRGNEFWVLPDRGPSDGAAHYQCRLHRVRLPIEPQGSQAVEILETIMLRDVRGVPFLGSSALFVSTGGQPRRFDPEGLRLDRDGNFLISDEYGPHVIRFNRQGVMIEELPVPQSFTVENPSAHGQEEDTNNTHGRRSNRGMEGLAVTPDKQFVVGLMQSPLLQDAELSSSGKPVGLNSRLWWFGQ
ncbi:MAG TPA: esterase-like activity of phytase family protein, partial [Pirellulaceae bacterium]|nr:esterase-like activity of phytase family protein [Pirellulaceae bacterium]